MFTAYLFSQEVDEFSFLENDRTQTSNFENKLPHLKPPKQAVKE